MVGIGTVLADDPMLDVRDVGLADRSPVRVVLDRALRLPGSSKLVHSARQTSLWVMTSGLSEAPAELSPMLLTCAQGWAKGQGCMQGNNGDEVGLLGLVSYAYLER